jgi:hypothetical protein
LGLVGGLFVLLDKPATAWFTVNRDECFEAEPTYFEKLESVSSSASKNQKRNLIDL